MDDRLRDLYYDKQRGFNSLKSFENRVAQLVLGQIGKIPSGGMDHNLLIRYSLEVLKEHQYFIRLLEMAQDIKLTFLQ